MMLSDLQEQHDSRTTLSSAYRDYCGVSLVAAETSSSPSSYSQPLLCELSAPMHSDTDHLTRANSDAPQDAETGCGTENNLRGMTRRVSGGGKAPRLAQVAKNDPCGFSSSPDACDADIVFDETTANAIVLQALWRCVQRDKLTWQMLASETGVSLQRLNALLSGKQIKNTNSNVRGKLIDWLKKHGGKVPTLLPPNLDGLDEIRQKWAFLSAPNALESLSADGTDFKQSRSTSSGKVRLTPQHLYAAYCLYLNRRERDGISGAGNEECFCFKCKDGGDVVLCDYHSNAGPCSKAYQLHCCNLKAIPEGEWECPRHRCVQCGCRHQMTDSDLEVGVEIKLWHCRTCPQTYCAQCLPERALHAGNEIICDLCQKLLKHDLRAICRDLVAWEKVPICSTEGKAIKEIKREG